MNTYSISSTFNIESFIPGIAHATRLENETIQANTTFLNIAETRFGEPTITKTPEFNNQTIS